MNLPPNWADNQRAQLRTLVQLAYNTHYKYRDLHLLIKNSLSLVAVAVGEHCQQKKTDNLDFPDTQVAQRSGRNRAKKSLNDVTINHQSAGHTNIEIFEPFHRFRYTSHLP